MISTVEWHSWVYFSVISLQAYIITHLISSIQYTLTECTRHNVLAVMSNDQIRTRISQKCPTLQNPRNTVWPTSFRLSLQNMEHLHSYKPFHPFVVRCRHLFFSARVYEVCSQVTRLWQSEKMMKKEGELWRRELNEWEVVHGKK